MLKNIGSTWLHLVVTIVVTYFLLRFNLRHLGKEQYGVWLLITSVTGYLTLLQLGVPMASVRHLTQAIASQDPSERDRLIASCAVLYLVLGAISACMGVLLFFVYQHLFDIPGDLQSQSTGAFFIVLGNVALGFIAQLPYAIMHSYQDFVRKNLVAIATVLFRAGLNVILVLWQPTLLVIAITQLLGTLLEMAALWTIIFYQHADLKIRPSRFSLAVIRDVFSFSLYVLFVGLGSQLSFQTGALIVGRYLGVSQVNYFANGHSLILYFMQFIIGIASVVMPLATQYQTQGRTDELRAVFLKWSKTAIALSCCAGLYFMVFGPAFLANWLGEDFREPGGNVLRILMPAYLVFLPVRGVGLPILMGLGQAARPSLAFLAAGAINVVLGVVLVHPWGLEGIAWGAAIPTFLVAAAMLVMTCSELKITVSDYLAQTVPRAAIGFFAALGSLFLFQHWVHPESFLALVMAGVVTVALSGVIWVGFVFHKDPHIHLPIQRLLVRAGSW